MTPERRREYGALRGSEAGLLRPRFSTRRAAQGAAAVHHTAEDGRPVAAHVFSRWRRDGRHPRRTTCCNWTRTVFRWCRPIRGFRISACLFRKRRLSTHPGTGRGGQSAAHCASRSRRRKSSWRCSTSRVVKVVTYLSGDEIQPGDRVLYHGDAGVVEFIASAGDPETAWYVQQFGRGCMINADGWSRVFVSEPDEDLELVSRDGGLA